MPDYELWLDSGSAGIKRSITYPILDADFGDGFYASVLAGDLNGTREYTLTWNNINRDQSALVQPRTFNSIGIGAPVTRYKYIWDFLFRRLSTGNSPFWFEDVDYKPGSRTILLCRLIPATFPQQQDRRNPLLYAYSIQLTQIRGAPPQS